MPTVAITGLSGVIGSLLLKSFPRDVTIIDLYRTHKSIIGKQHTVSHVPFDLLDPKAIVATLEQIKPDCIIHLAGLTHIDRCEEEKYLGKDGLPWKVNVEGTRAIAQYSKNAGCFLLYLSTECVFDGKSGGYLENAATSPINWYGFTKAAAEDVVQQLSANSAVLRSVIAFHPQDNGKTLFGWMASKIQKGEPIRAVNDLYFAPTYTYDIIEVIQLLYSKKMTGIYHVDTQKELTPFDFAQYIRRAYDSTVPVNGVSAVDFFGEDRLKLRLLHASLDSSYSQKKLGFSTQTIENVFKNVAL